MLIKTREGLRPLVLVSATYVADTDAELRELPGSSSGVRYAIVLRHIATRQLNLERGTVARRAKQDSLLL